jgi:hypothetical protein
VDGRAGPDHPAWAITLAHADGPRFVFVTSCPRDRFRAVMVRPGDDVPEEVALQLAMVQINLALFCLERPVIDSATGLVKALVRDAERRARDYRSWSQTAWTIRRAGLPDDKAAASLTSLAGWRSGFTLDHPDLYLLVHTHGWGTDQLELMPADDTMLYGFDANTPTLPAEIPPEGFPPRASRLRPDLRKVLADDEDPGHRNVGHGQVDSSG